MIYLMKDDKPVFNKKTWQREYMREYRKGLRRLSPAAVTGPVEATSWEGVSS
jgi:hypothetical protein